MRHHRNILAVAAALSVWTGTAIANPPERDEFLAEAPGVPTWIAVEARNHMTGAHGLAAVLFGIAQERGRRQVATLRVDCFDGQTSVHLDADGLGNGPFAVEVRQSLDGGRFVPGAWAPSRDRQGLMLSGDRAGAFVTGLYEQTELRLAVIRPLSVPYLVTFVVRGAEPALRPLADRCQWPGGPAISDAGR